MFDTNIHFYICCNNNNNNTIDESLPINSKLLDISLEVKVTRIVFSLSHCLLSVSLSSSLSVSLCLSLSLSNPLLSPPAPPPGQVFPGSEPEQRGGGVLHPGGGPGPGHAGGPGGVLLQVAG